MPHIDMITREESNQVMSEIVDLLKSRGVNLSGLRNSRPDDFEHIANLIHRLNDQQWNYRDQKWEPRHAATLQP